MPKKKNNQPKTTLKVAKEEAKVAEDKKSSSKKPGNEIDDIFSVKKRKKVEEAKVAKEEAKVAEDKKSLPKKPGNEIDDIFSMKKRKKVEDSTEKPAGKDKVKNRKIRATNGFDGFGEPEVRARKKTNDGLNIYTEEELGISKSDAGNTPLCPFDCSCCF